MIWMTNPGSRILNRGFAYAPGGLTGASPELQLFIGNICHRKLNICYYIFITLFCENRYICEILKLLI